MNHMTIEDAIQHLQGMAESLKKYKEKYPNAKYKGIKLRIDGQELEEARRDGDSIGYWSINGEEIRMGISFSTETEEE